MTYFSLNVVKKWMWRNSGIEVHMFLKDLNRKLTFQKCFLSELFFPVPFCQNHPFCGHLLWINRYFPREEFLRCIYISLSTISCFENVWVQCLPEAGEAFSMLCLPCRVFSFPQQLAQFGVRVGILACMDSWLILWHRILCSCFKGWGFLGKT